MLVQCPAISEAAAKIAAHIGTILAHTQYGKGLKKPKSKGKNSYYMLYHYAAVLGGNAGPVPLKLGKATLKY